MLPDPLAAQVPPPLPTQVHATPVSAAGITSATVAPLTALGPAFTATMVYVIADPGRTLPCPSVFVIARSAWGVSVSVSVAELLPGTGSATPAGSVTVAVLLSLPVAEALIVPVSVYVTAAPTGRFTTSLMLPDPAAVHVPPPLPTHVQVAPLIGPGRASVTIAPFAAFGPRFDATIVYVTV